MSFEPSIADTDRFEMYGHPLENFTRIAKMWSEILGVEVTPIQHAECMIAVKKSREMHKHNPDNAIDIKGYERCIEMIKESGH